MKRLKIVDIVDTRSKNVKFQGCSQCRYCFNSTEDCWERKCVHVLDRESLKECFMPDTSNCNISIREYENGETVIEKIID